MSLLEYAGEIAEGLEDSPVWVDPAAEHLVPASAREALEAKAEAVDWPVYAILTAPDRADGDLSTLVHSQVGAEEGVYLVVESNSAVVWKKVELEDHEVFREVNQRIEAGREEAGGGREGVAQLQAALDSLADEDFEVTEHDTGLGYAPPAPAPRTEYVGMGTDLVYALIMVPLLIIAGLAILAGLRRRRRPVRRYEMPESLLRSASELQREDMRRELSADSLSISSRLSELDTADLSAELQDTVRHGLDAYSLAGRIVDDPSATRADLAGALVLLRTAAHDIAAVESAGDRKLTLGKGKRPAADPPRLCVVDPGHGPATTATEVPVASGTAAFSSAGSAAGGSPDGANGRRARVPVCRDCDRDLAAQREPSWLLVEGVPYVEGETVWARTLYGSLGGDLVELLKTDRGVRG